MPVKAKYIKDLPLKRVLDGSESLLVQDLNGTQQAPLEMIVDEIKQNSQEKIREIESELNQTNAQLSDVEKILDDGWINVEVFGVKKYATSQDALKNVAQDNNTAIVNDLLNKGFKLKFGSGYYAFDNQIEIVKITNGIKGIYQNTNLLFPNSKGIVFTKPSYYGRFVLKGLNITSKYHCVDFDNEGGESPNNVYQMDIKDLILDSEQGHCIYGGDNYNNQNHDMRVFETTFYNISVKAPNGSGFYGFNGLGIRFDYCRDYGSIKNVFQNCGGKFVNINTSFAQAEWFLYYDDFAPDNYGVYLEFDNVNIEHLTKGIICSKKTNIHIQTLILKNSSFSPLILNERKLTESPIKVANIKKFILLNSSLSFSSSYFDLNIVKAPIHIIGGGGSLPVYTNFDTSLSFYTEANGLVVELEKTHGLEYSIYDYQWGKNKFQLHEELHAKTLKGCRQRCVLNYNGIKNNFTSDLLYDEIIFKVSSDSSLSWLSMNGIKSSTMITITNDATSTNNITLKHNEGYGNRFFLVNNSPLVLEPGDSASFINRKKSTYNQWEEILTASRLNSLS